MNLPISMKNSKDISSYQQMFKRSWYWISAIYSSIRYQWLRLTTNIISGDYGIICEKCNHQRIDSIEQRSNYESDFKLLGLKVSVNINSFVW